MIYHIFAALLVICAAFPIRVWFCIGKFIPSFSILDILLFIGALIFILYIFITGKFYMGDKIIFLLLCIPLIISFFSLIWTQDLIITIKWVIIFIEAIIIYLITVNLFNNFKSQVIMNYISLFVILCILTAAFGVLRIPGFNPQIPPEMINNPQIPPEMINKTPIYLNYMTSYYARLSHPFLGLSNNFATVLAFFPFIFFNWGNLMKKRFYFWMTLFTMITIFFTMSRGVIFALIIVFILYFILNCKLILKLTPKLIIILLLIIISFYFYCEMNPLVKKYLPGRLSKINIYDRLIRLNLGYQKVINRPLLGYGAGVTPWEKHELEGEIHNTFLQQLVYFGIIFGFIVVISLILIPVRFFIWRTKYPKVKFMAKAIAFSILAQLIIFLSQASFEGSVLRILLYFSVGLVVAFLNSFEKENSLINI